MKNGLLICILFVAFRASANDTLTVAQVYNFSVGDTFDYRYYSYYEGFNIAEGQCYPITTLSYARYAITNIFYSSDSSTKYIQRKRIYPNPEISDTLVYNNLSNYQVYFDTECSFNQPGDTIVTDSVSIYHDRPLNMVISNCSWLFNQYMFVEGLGTAVSVYINNLSIECGYRQDSVELIYYSKGSETWGTPYFDWPDYTGIAGPNPDNPQITLYPTINNGSFQVRLAALSTQPINFIIYDLTGRKIMQTDLSNGENTVNIESCSSGIYIWKAVLSGRTLQTGKMIIH